MGVLGCVQAWGVLEYRAGCLERARELFQQGVWADPGSAGVALVFQAWGVLEQAAGNMQLARELFRCAVKADPKSETSWQVRITCCHRPVPNQHCPTRRLCLRNFLPCSAQISRAKQELLAAKANCQMPAPLILSR